MNSKRWTIILTATTFMACGDPATKNAEPSNNSGNNSTTANNANNGNNATSNNATTNNATTNNATTNNATTNNTNSTTGTLQPVIVTIQGDGTVESDPAGIDCPETCNANFDQGSQLTLTATASDGSRFTGWTGDCDGTANPLTVAVDEPLACIATFEARGSDTTIGWYGNFGTYEFMDVAPVGDGTAIAVGFTEVIGTGGNEAIAARIAADGSVMWSKSFGGSDADEFNSIEPTGTGDFMIAGSSNSFATDLGVGIVVRIGADGTKKWARQYEERLVNFTGIARISNTRFAVSGTWMDTQSAFKPLIVEIDDQGNIDRQKRGDGAAFADFSNVASLGSNGYVAMRDTGTVAKFNSSGLMEWSWRVDTSARSGGAVDVFPTSDGEMIAVGWVTTEFTGVQDALIVKLDQDGSVTWQRRMGGGEFPSIALSGVERSDGSLVISGKNDSNARAYAWLVELDAGGNLVSQQGFGRTPYLQSWRSAKIGDDGRLYLAGRTSIPGEGNYASALFGVLDPVDLGSACWATTEPQIQVGTTSATGASGPTSLQNTGMTTSQLSANLVDFTLVQENGCMMN